jgi:threonine/homoserine/homoserine lactone efflux protein
MLNAWLTLLPISALLSVTPGAASAMVVRSAVRGGRRHAFFTTAGNSIGVLGWGCFAAVGIATVIATSAEAFAAVKLVGAVILIVMGVQSLRGVHDVSRRAAAGRTHAIASDRRALRAGLLTSVANPKLAVFFVALSRSSCLAGRRAASRAGDGCVGRRVRPDLVLDARARRQSSQARVHRGTVATGG